MNGLEGASREQLKDVMVSCAGSTRVTAKVIFPDRFYLPFSTVHDPIFEALDNDTLQKVVIAAPRGWGKTSTSNLAYPAKKILFREKKFIVPISNTATQAVMQAENLKSELLSNPIVKHLFGPMKSNQFSKEQWVTESGTMVMPRGSGQQVRGFLFGNYRPDLIIGDDLEDTESVKNEDQRKKLKEWFFADVLNSVNRSLNNWKVVVIGTLLHEDSLLANLLEDESWTRILIQLCDDNYNSLWPDFMSTEKVKQLVEEYRAQGILDTFYREYRNMAISTEDAVFLGSYFKYFEEQELKEIKTLENIVIVDPAKTVKLHSAESAIVGLGADLYGQRFFVRDIVAERMYPDKLIDEAITTCLGLKTLILALEVTGLNEWLLYPFENEIRRRGLPIQIIPINATTDKLERIAMLAPYYRKGQIYHNKANCGVLEGQLLGFPRSKRLDVMDALAHFPRVLMEGERFFVNSSIMDRDEQMPEPEDEGEGFIDTADDMVSSGSWRSC